MSSKRVLYTGLAGNVLVAVTKAIAALMTRSSAMWAEAVHSAVDCGDQILLLYGLHRSKLPPDEAHPLGHGRELYFWSFIVALMIFAVGAGISIYEGVLHIRQPEPINNPLLNYIVLALSLVFQGWSSVVAFREVKKAKGSMGFIEGFQNSKNPPAYMVLFEDVADILGIVIAAIAVFGVTHFHVAALDGIASILIGLILATIAIGLARESKSLLIGEQATLTLRRSIVHIAKDVSDVQEVEVVLAVQLSPEQVVAALKVRFPDALRAPQLAEQIKRIEHAIQQRHPEVIALYVRPRD
ncbi:MAG TPA: cation diffusion facilitator family transporter [Gemmatimonadales bacterium]|jgi:cation diffusion facilitator family transporter